MSYSMLGSESLLFHSRTLGWYWGWINGRMSYSPATVIAVGCKPNAHRPSAWFGLDIFSNRPWSSAISGSAPCRGFRSLKCGNHCATACKPHRTCHGYQRGSPLRILFSLLRRLRRAVPLVHYHSLVGALEGLNPFWPTWVVLYILDPPGHDGIGMYISV